MNKEVNNQETNKMVLDLGKFLGLNEDDRKRIYIKDLVLINFKDINKNKWHFITINDEDKPQILTTSIDRKFLETNDNIYIHIYETIKNIIINSKLTDQWYWCYKDIIVTTIEGKVYLKLLTKDVLEQDKEKNSIYIEILDLFNNELPNDKIDEVLNKND